MSSPEDECHLHIQNISFWRYLKLSLKMRRKNGQFLPFFSIFQVNYMGYSYGIYPSIKHRHRVNTASKDWSSAEFTFLSNSHRLGVHERKENSMTSIAFIFLLFARLVIPFAVPITLGEWVRRREIKYGCQM